MQQYTSILKKRENEGKGAPPRLMYIAIRYAGPLFKTRGKGSGCG